MRHGIFPVLFGGEITYAQRMKNLFGSSLIAHWPLSETSGSVAHDVSGNNLNGTYSGVSLAGTKSFLNLPAPTFDGNNGYVNLYSAQLASLFNTSEGTKSVWIKILDPAVWSDGAIRTISRIGVNATDANQIIMQKTATANQLVMNYRAGGTTKQRAINGQSSTDWINLILTWSVSADTVKAYINGSDGGVTVTGLGTWSGNIGSSCFCCGVGDTVNKANDWIGSMSDVLILNRAATPAEAAKIFFLNDDITPAAMLMFDSIELSSQYQIAYPILSERGITSTIYAATDYINTEGWMSADQLLELDAAGWPIADHTKTHAVLSTLSKADQITELSGGKSALDGFGLTRASSHVAYPQGSYNNDTIVAMQELGMLTGRKTGTSDFFTPKTVGLYEIPCNNVYSYTGVSTVTGWIDDAIIKKRIIAFFFHGLVASSPTTYQYKISDFETIADYLISTKIRTINILDYYGMVTK
jgi:peptidoglycan/xylan/chitin deacetylase (PgdA/CDA1 family)